MNNSQPTILHLRPASTTERAEAMRHFLLQYGYWGQYITWCSLWGEDDGIVTKQGDLALFISRAGYQREFEEWAAAIDRDILLSGLKDHRRRAEELYTEWLINYCEEHSEAMAGF